ncbi:sensor histidine kinase [Amycolatopsis sp. H20-H5]|uniref:sensor histidine kinase n=1 Tax=Amycolatopsis sp. H20-H5 TaxID=3046309 RepID=UPI002DBD42D3|nr:HAMP domain-containing sensor histidine kinase [Amycolatopsis sp. H20-H5]MEC3976200.1 HAMP domain-containing sensor histidine kinase [Amycolatopsis sp. H20-H5]
MKTPKRRSADAAMLRSASLRVGLQTAAAVAVTVLVLVGIAVLVVLRDQHRQQDELLSDTVTRADDVTDPPAGVWLVLQDASGRRVSPGAPAGFPLEADLRDTAQDGVTRNHHVKVGPVEYQVLTQRGSAILVQGVLSLSDAHRERGRLITALLLCGAAGLLVAALAGAWLGRRAVIPLARALALQHRFVADAGHELRTPLTLLSTRAQLVRRGLRRNADPATLQSEVDGLVADADQLAAILEDLLLAADPRTGDAHRPVELPLLVDQEIAAARPLARQRDVTVDVVASGTGPLVVDGSETALRRAVNALVDNAVRHANGAVLVTIAGVGKQVRLDVADDGPGIDPAMLPTLFERFASGSDGRRGHGHRRYGLGLALVAEIAARHGGTVSARTERDGAVLSVSLPRATP